MQAFNKIAINLETNAALNELNDNAHLFGEFSARKKSGPIHAEMDDIWLRYGDIREMEKTGDYSKIAEEHDSIWLQDLPECRKLCFDVMNLVEGERLGGVLITRLPSGGKILPHSDLYGWHASYYSKVFIPILNRKGAIFGFDDGIIEPEIGEAYMFDNSKNHWVVNGSNEDRIAMVVCLKQSKYHENGVIRD